MSGASWRSQLASGTAPSPNIDDLERVQKYAFKIIIENEYTSYEKSLGRLDMETLYNSCEQLCLNVELKSLKNPKTDGMFQLNEKKHVMGTRNPDTYTVQHALKLPIIYMQSLLNEYESKLSLKQSEACIICSPSVELIVTSEFFQVEQSQ